MNVDQSEQRTCAECGGAYLFTEPEQRFRAEQGMSAPIRCPECRSVHRRQRNADLVMNGKTSAFSSAEQGNDRRRSPRNHRSQNASDRYPAICADCGASTMVPFIPRGDRPVYCRNCYNARRGR